MNFIKTFILLITGLYLTLSASCQDSFYVKVHFPSRLSLKSLTVSYEDGKNNLVYKSLNEYTIAISAPLYAKYADITLYYPDSAHVTGQTHFTNSFWVGKERADIVVTPKSPGQDPVANCILTNAWSIRQMGRDKLDSFQRKEWKALVDYINVPRQPSDSNTRAVYALFSRLRIRQLEFIRQNPNSYFSLWLFRKEIAASNQVSADTVAVVFNTVFPDSLRNSPDRNVILRAIAAKKNTNKGEIAPDYTSTTSAGRIVSPEFNKGKYTLLAFWASWCGPCVAEIPTIVAIRRKYDSTKLSIISITLDEERKSFEDAVTRYHMDWPQVFGNQDIIHAYQISGIPQLYLIDPEGKIIYKAPEEDIVGNSSGDSADLKQLNDILTQKLDNTK